MSEQQQARAMETGPVRLRYPEPPLSNGVIALREWRERDVPAMVEACSDPLIAKYTTVPQPYSEAEATKWLREQPGEREQGKSISFAIEDVESGLAIGNVAIVSTNWEHCRAEVGYWLHPAARGQGVTAQALTLVTAWGFAELGVERFDLLAEVSNKASQRVAERAGFTREGVLRSYNGDHDARRTMVMFSLLREDLEHGADASPPTG